MTVGDMAWGQHECGLTAWIPRIRCPRGEINFHLRGHEKTCCSWLLGTKEGGHIGEILISEIGKFSAQVGLRSD